jgi:hypothetical protein
MKRARRQKYGNCSGKQRRRMHKILRAVEKGWGPGNWARTPCEMRDARRLAEAGLIVCAISKYRVWATRPLAELEFFKTLSDALARYPRNRIMPGRHPK